VLADSVRQLEQETVKAARFRFFLRAKPCRIPTSKTGEKP